MTTAPVRNPTGKTDAHQRMAKHTREMHVHFAAGLPGDDSTDSSDGDSTVPFKEEPESSSEPRTPSNHGISSRIKKRKMPVRRPTGYLSGKERIQQKENDKDATEREESSDTSQTPSSNDKKTRVTSTLEQRLRELSMKYKLQEQSPEREQSPSTKKFFTVVKKK
ncbi:hypothetical protein GCK32_000467 [Trichostrongylus colubriformis]|uniref:Uncharacterized protein n=1 Tax=Trichostrongylus colubriformis TaxID=6319 RepID=A0AAN8ITV9_TRICO